MKKIAVFASGTGTNFDAIQKAIEEGQLQAEIALVVVDKKTAKVIEKARSKGIETYVFSYKDFENKAECEKEIVRRCKEAGVEWIALAGYMRIITNVLLDAFPNRIINIHPALLPSFKGAHGIADAYNYGCKVMGVTIHYVNEEMDAGKIIAQRAFDVPEKATLEEVEVMIHQIEHVLYPETLQKLLEE